MTPEERAVADAHNAKVKALADRMPARALNHAVCAIGYRANWHTGITSNFTIPRLAHESRKQSNLNGIYAIGKSRLADAIATLSAAGVIEVRHGQLRNGKRQASSYVIDYGYTDTERIAEVWETVGRRQRRRQRQAANVTRPVQLATVESPELAANAAPAADDEAARLAALDDYPEPPDDDCPVCDGSHNPKDHTEAEKWGCETCARHQAAGHDRDWYKRM